MSVSVEPRSSKGRFHQLFTIAGIAFVFMGLVVLPQTRSNVWSPSDAGSIVGP